MDIDSGSRQTRVQAPAFRCVSYVTPKRTLSLSVLSSADSRLSVHWCVGGPHRGKSQQWQERGCRDCSCRSGDKGLA